MRFLLSAGEASGDYYAAGVARLLPFLYPAVEMYGCAGPRLQSAGVEPVVDAAALGVVGLAEVVRHLPRIYGQYRKLVRHAIQHRPDAALLVDNPDFNLRLAKQLKALGVPVFYLVAPQVWAWRQGRVQGIRRVVDHLFCLFPFEEKWFRDRGVHATYVGHPLASSAAPRTSGPEFRRRYGLPSSTRIVTLLPGSRDGEALRHLPVLLETVSRLASACDVVFVLAMPAGFSQTEAFRTFREPIEARSIQVVENDTTDAIAHAAVALAASGTVTVEAAVLGTPMVTFYRVNPLTWWAGRRLVKVPYLSMVNLIAERPVVPELMQDQMTAERLSEAALRLLSDEDAAAHMQEELRRVRLILTRDGDPFGRVASIIEQDLRSHQFRSRTPGPTATGED